jgi:MFS transporter, ACS family, hexuronate transporter
VNQSASITGSLGTRIGYRRWTICALLFFATTVNYMDRQILGILAPDLQREIGWSERQYSWITMSFQAAYAAGLLVAGGLMDRFGTRLGYAVSVGLWSVAAMAHAGARSALQFGIVRFTLGLGEAGNFPAAIKTVAEWFPKRERALATGIFNAGANVGAVATPLLVPLIVRWWGWQAAFLVTGAVGFVWVALWLALYRPPEEHPGVSAAELAHILSDPPESTVKIPWSAVIPYRQTWAFALGKFLTDPIWWFYLFWLGKFFDKTYGLKLDQLMAPLFIVYLMADIGSIGAGWLSSALIRRGWSINGGRKTTMLLCALAVVPVVAAPLASNMWTAVAVIGLALAAHQGWSANLFTLVSDTFPRRAVGSVVGFGGMMGAVGGFLLSNFAGEVLQRTGRYLPMFVVAASAYLLALAVIHLLAPRLEPAVFGDDSIDKGAVS